MEPLAQAMYSIGVKSAMVVHGEDGLDEISLSAPTFVCEGAFIVAVDARLAATQNP